MVFSLPPPVLRLSELDVDSLPRLLLDGADSGSAPLPTDLGLLMFYLMCVLSCGFLLLGGLHLTNLTCVVEGWCGDKGGGGKLLVKSPL